MLQDCNMQKTCILSYCWKSIDCIIPEANVAPKLLYEAWNADQEPAKAVIVLSLADNQLVKIMKAKTALEMITILDSEFESKAVVNKIILKKRLFSFCLEEDKSLSSYVNDFDALLLQLGAINVVVDPEDAAIQLLVGLPASYGPLVTVLETNEY